MTFPFVPPLNFEAQDVVQQAELERRRKHAERKAKAAADLAGLNGRPVAGLSKTEIDTLLTILGQLLNVVDETGAVRSGGVTTDKPTIVQKAKK